ncbi:uncharacterized protein UTRI_02755 [Ustilago trichophora]|uniref:Uncharacterized protein n=1 Tax=Ustilago trichophora TaxID=86804 RepID=A0A5C3ENS3_9BASI|nr:uncharacterized protein UTRI_02755 [Ustilago trichophora]
MGSCMSKTTVVQEVNPPPHPEARRLWLVSTQIDPKHVPLDLVGIDADGLKAAMRNRGLETEHWALKVDSPSDEKAEPSIFDITLEGGTLVSQLHSTSSPYWNAITRRVAIGWTIWKDQEIMHASKLLIQARPKYDGRANNSQQLARLLGRHIDFAPPSQQTVTTSTSETFAGHATSPVGSILKPESMRHDAASASTPANNRSQMTLVSGAHSQRSQSIESDPAHEMGDNVSRVPASIRHSQRMSIARPPLIHLSTAPSVAGSEPGGLAPPSLQRSPETEQSASSPTGSVRVSLPPQPRQQSPLNPSYRTHRQTASEIRSDGRARTRSDAAYASMGAADRRMTMDVPRDGTTTAGRVSRPVRRRSEAPSEWLAEMPTNNGDSRFNSTRSRSGQPPRNTHRDSIMSSGASMIASPSLSTWSPSMGFAASPSMGMPGMPGMPAMPMPGFATPPHMSLPMAPINMWPSTNSIMFNPGANSALQVPMPYFATHPPPPSPQWMHQMPMLAPPSPGFHSHTSSAVPTPPESPHLSTTHVSKNLTPPEISFHGVRA